MRKDSRFKVLLLVTALAALLACGGQEDGTDSAEAVTGAEASAYTGSGGDVMLQGFIWGWQSGWWNTISTTAPTIKAGGFTLVWLPPPSASADAHGYLPNQWYLLSSAYGTQAQLQGAISTLHSNGIRVISDMVVNHRVGTFNWGDFSNPAFADNNKAICNNDEFFAAGNPGAGVPVSARGGADTGDGFGGGRDLDHNNTSVQSSIRAWQSTLRGLGYDGWRYDFVKGFSASTLGAYNSASAPYFSVGEYWPTQAFSQGNPGAWRTLISNWVSSTGSRSAAFDFVTKPLLAAALSGNNFALLNNAGKPAGLIGTNPAYSVTFLDNHDTAPASGGQNIWPFPSANVEQGYAYILTHPGIPCVFWSHYFDWGTPLQTAIKKMIAIRKSKGITSTSSVAIQVANTSVYAAIVNGNVAMKMGPGSWSPSGTWTLAQSGTNYAIWTK